MRVFACDSPGLCGFFASVEPPALAAVALVTLNRGKHAIEPLPDFMPQKRDGWLLDATGDTVKLWCKPTGRAVQVSPRAFIVATELYARLALSPWEGLLAGTPGGDLAGKAPAWVDGLRIAHIELLRALRAGDLEPLAPLEPGTPGPLELGSYTHGDLQVHLTERGVVLNEYLVAELLTLRLELELPAILEALLDHASHTLPFLPANLGGRKPTTLIPRGAGVEIQHDGASRVVDRDHLVRLVELDLRRVLQRFGGQRIARDKRPETGAPPWVGRGWAVWGRAVGRLLGDRLQRG